MHADPAGNGTSVEQERTPDVTRRQVLKAGAVGAGAALLPLAWSASPVSAAAPPEVGAANGLALWYAQSAGTDWLRALPIGNGRLGAMVFGNVDVERLQLNEDTIWAGGPYDSANTRGAANLAEIRRRVFADQWGPGTRIPALLISPQLRRPFGVDHTSHDTTSIMATIEHRFHLAPLGSRDARVADLLASCR